ncbi:MAG: hypothetical protein PWP23_648 [Candidatus Sumerlaeota bacterium]|nr:hypothetical protein [Candidatus Sumerlaeota bacterium]
MDLGHLMNEATPCCVHLRCKSMRCRGDERPGLLHHEDAMTYWCSITEDAIGPDRRSAVHPECQPGRSCYEAAPGFD